MEKQSILNFSEKIDRKDNLPISLSKLLIKEYKVERAESLKFFGVLLDENQSRKDHIKNIKNKDSKKTSLLY